MWTQSLIRTFLAAVAPSYRVLPRILGHRLTQVNAQPFFPPPAISKENLRLRILFAVAAVAPSLQGGIFAVCRACFLTRAPFTT